ncbi:PorV/PorQ family protein [Candidatus Poribacteria bacterium]|nr:PorV/PorQ family protein [Candidatus Poribacteria bacterium]
MTKLKIAICAIWLFISIFTPITFAAFNDIGVGARPFGLGGAFVALADDGNAANYNPAGLGYIDDIRVSLTTAQRFKGRITYNYIGGVLPLGGAGSLGASIGILSEDSEIYQEQTIRLSYGRAFSQKFSFGVNLTSFGTSFDENNEFVKFNDYFVDTSASAFSLDVGVIAKPVTGLNIGLSAENLIPADVSISELEEDNIPINVRVGLAYNLAAIAENTQQESLREILKSGLGLIEIAFRDGDRHVRVGAEVWLNRSIGLRAGYALKSGVNSATTIALGGSAKISVSTALALQLDYAFQILSGDFEDNTTQRVSLNLIF